MNDIFFLIFLSDFFSENGASWKPDDPNSANFTIYHYNLHPDGDGHIFNSLIEEYKLSNQSPNSFSKQLYALTDSFHKQSTNISSPVPIFILYLSAMQTRTDTFANCRSWWDGLPPHQDLHCLPFCLILAKTPISTMDVQTQSWKNSIQKPSGESVSLAYLHVPDHSLVVPYILSYNTSLEISYPCGHYFIPLGLTDISAIKPV